MSIKTIIFLAILLAPAVIAADWVEVNVRYSWTRQSVGFCQTASQCLVSNAFNESWDNFPDRYWSEVANSQKPKCINNTQYIADNYCDNGIWSTRTRLVATQLLAVALNKSDTNFSIYCDTYDDVLNKYAYSTDYGPVTTFLRKFCSQTGNRVVENCVNNICVMRYANNMAFGMAINTDISGTKSPLQALNLSATECDNTKNNDGDYDACGDEVWYNHDTQSILYVPAVSPLPPILPIITDYFMVPYNKLRTYVFDYIHDPDIAQYNYTFFNLTPQFNYISIAREGTDFTYSFKQANITHNNIPTEYAGWYFTNIQLPENACDRIIKRYDGKASCEVQPSPTEFYVVAYKKPPSNPILKPVSIVDAWQDMTGKLRVN